MLLTATREKVVVVMVVVGGGRSRGRDIKRYQEREKDG